MNCICDSVAAADTDRLLLHSLASFLQLLRLLLVVVEVVHRVGTSDLGRLHVRALLLLLPLFLASIEEV